MSNTNKVVKKGGSPSAISVGLNKSNGSAISRIAVESAVGRGAGGVESQVAEGRVYPSNHEKISPIVKTNGSDPAGIIPPNGSGLPSDASNDAGVGVAILVVTKLCLNQKIVLATKLGCTEVLHVRVRSSENFLPKMQMRCRHESGTRWTLIGNCPRWRGKW